MVVSATRSTMATALPTTIALLRCLVGRLRAASAMTAALSPDSRMLIQMIVPSAIQNDCCRDLFHAPSKRVPHRRSR